MICPTPALGGRVTERRGGVARHAGRSPCRRPWSAPGSRRRSTPSRAPTMRTGVGDIALHHLHPLVPRFVGELLRASGPGSAPGAPRRAARAPGGHRCSPVAPVTRTSVASSLHGRLIYRTRATVPAPSEPPTVAGRVTPVPPRPSGARRTGPTRWLITRLVLVPARRRRTQDRIGADRRAPGGAQPLGGRPGVRPDRRDAGRDRRPGRRCWCWGWTRTGCPSSARSSCTRPPSCAPASTPARRWA